MCKVLGAQRRNNTQILGDGSLTGLKRGGSSVSGSIPHSPLNNTHMTHTAKFRNKDGKLLCTYTTKDKFPGKFFWKKTVAEQLAKVAKSHDIPADSIFVEETEWQQN
jgi:hypothetical protein